MSRVGWVERRSPTISMFELGYAIANPTDDFKVDFPDLILVQQRTEDAIANDSLLQKEQ